MRAAVRCPDSRRAMLRPELAAAPINSTIPIVAVAYSSGMPNNNVASDPGAKKSMMRPITHGIPRLTPVEMTKQNTPAVMSFHCGRANSSMRMMEATSGLSSSFLGVLAIAFESDLSSSGVLSSVVTSVEGDGGVFDIVRST